MTIIKRKKQDKFFIMNNSAVQTHLTSLNSIGLLSYITSLPSDWQIYKTQLYSKFSRKTVDSAWKELIEKKYIAGFSCYVDRKKQYYYIASDEELTDSEYNEFVKETFFEIFEEKKFIAKNLQMIKDNQFEITFNFKEEAEKLESSSVVPNGQHLKNEDLSDVRLVQYLENSSTSTVLDEHIQSNYIQSTKKQINNEKENKYVNIENFKLRSYKFDDKDFDEIADKIFNSLFAKHNEGLFDKKQWSHICVQIKKEFKSNKVVTSDLYIYLETIIKTICSRRKKKLGLETPQVPASLWNWLEA